MMDLSKTEVIRRTQDGIFKCIVDVQTGWRWYREREILAACRVALSRTAIMTAEKNTLLAESTEDLGVSKKQPAKKKQTVESDPLRERIANVEYTSSQGKEVFQALNENKTQVQIVLELGLHPVMVAIIARDFARMSGTFLVSPGFLREFERLPLSGVALPLESEKQLLDAIRSNLGVPLCAACGKEKMRVCGKCGPGQQMTG